jgi:hypothetical protein
MQHFSPLVCTVFAICPELGAKEMLMHIVSA